MAHTITKSTAASTFFTQYLKAFRDALQQVEVTLGEDGTVLTLEEGVAHVYPWFKDLGDNKIMLVGNGGSAGISSHIAVDYWKNGRMRATAFNDASLLTCVSNDLGHAEVFREPVDMFADSNDILICISSSGNSENIINAAHKGLEKGCHLLTLTGFSPDNMLRKLGHVNFWVPSNAYGHVEVSHELILHGLLDAKLTLENTMDIFNRNAPL